MKDMCWVSRGLETKIITDATGMKLLLFSSPGVLKSMFSHFCTMGNTVNVLLAG